MPATRAGHPTLSIAIPLYDEEAVLPTLYARLTAALAGEASYEIIFVNDGSHDGTLDQLRALAASDPHIVALDLSRNFGHQAAVTAGLEAARGAAVILMDGDLQDPPEVIPELLAEWRAGYQVVVARRRSRQDSGGRGFGFRLFHRLFGLVSDFPIDPDTGIFGLMDRRAATELIGLRERNRFLPGMRSWVGFRQTTVWYDRAARAAGEPKQTIRRLLQYGFDAVFSFSYKPLRLSWLFGFIVSIFSFIYGAVLLLMRIFGINVVVGFTTPTVAILFLSGIQLVTIGILGEYLGRIYDEVKRRPTTSSPSRSAKRPRPQRRYQRPPRPTPRPSKRALPRPAPPSVSARPPVATDTPPARNQAPTPAFYSRRPFQPVPWSRYDKSSGLSVLWRKYLGTFL